MLPKRFIVFIVFGGINTALTYGLYLGLLLVVPYAIAYSLTFVAGIFLSYWLNATFVFRQPLRLKAALQYPAVYALQYIAGMIILYVGIEIFHISKAIAPLAAVALTIPLTYVCSRILITGA